MLLGIIENHSLFIPQHARDSSFSSYYVFRIMPVFNSGSSLLSSLTDADKTGSDFLAISSEGASLQEQPP